jgi:hypothetical protein
MQQSPPEVLAPPKDYTEYWEAQVLLVRILQNSGLRVGVKDRLPIFRLWLLVTSRITGAKQVNLLQLLNAMAKMRISGREPPHNGKTYT